MNTSISLFYGVLRLFQIYSRGTDAAENMHNSDFLAFSLVFFLAKKSKVPGLGFPSLWEVIARDAVRYFLVIFTSHLVLELTLIFARVRPFLSLNCS